MHSRLLLITVLAGSCPGLRADFSYEQTSKITGGAMAGMMKFAGAFSKELREPIVTTVSVKGNRMAHINKHSVQITDLDKETITNVNLDKRTYSVMTFAQTKEMMEQMAQKAQSNKPDTANLDFAVDVKDTGQTRSFLGKEAHEMLMTLKMQGTDAKTGNKGGIDMVVDMWLAAGIPGSDEMRDFQRRMAEKMSWAPGANPMMMNQPQMARGMAELYKQRGKLDGIPVYEVVKMNGNAEGMPDAQAAGSQSSDSRRQSSEAPPPSVSDAIGSALGGRLGIGGFGRKKKPQDQPKDQPKENASSEQSGGRQSASGSLMEMTMEVTSFSSSVDSSKFDVPAGFNKVEEDPMGGRGRRR